jgi:hypothetical protein
MDVIESIRIAMRHRIVGDGKICSREQFQEEFGNVPDEAGNFYIRETVLDMGRSEPSQATELQSVLCEYDIIIHRLLLNPTLTAYNCVEKFRSEFNVKDPEKVNIELAEQKNAQAWVSEPITCKAPEQDGDYFRIPVLIYVDCLIG